MKIKTKLILTNALMCIAFIGLAGYAWEVASTVSSYTDKLYRHPYAVGNAVRDVKIGIVSMHRSMKDVALASDAGLIDDAAAKVNAGEAEVLTAFGVIHERFLGDMGDVDAAEKAFTEWKPIRTQVIELKRQGDDQQAAAITKDQGAKKLAQLNATVDKIADFANEKGAAFYENAKASATSAVNMLIGISGGVCLLILVMAVWTVRGVLKPLRQITERVQSIAEGDADLTRQIEMNRRDEFGTLGGFFNTFITRIHDVIAEVSGVTREVASAASEIAASSEQIASGMTDQSQQVTQVSSAVEQMSSSVIEVARKSADAAGSANESGRIATEGGAVVEETILGMNAINDAVLASAAAVQELGKRGDQIGEVITVINDIADQTNLLALNAAIEAARAGEHGRGFAVVADEVRKLADRTTTATEEIASSIKAIQQETTQAVEGMTAGTDQVRVGVEKAQRAGGSLKQIVASAQDVSTMIQAIAAAAEQQSAASEEVSRNMERISHVTRETTDATNQAATAASQLSERAETLQRLVGQFKTN